MTGKKYRAGIAGLGMIGGADQVSAEAIGQSVDGMDGTHFAALAGNERVGLVAGSSRDAGRRERFASRSGAAVYEQLQEMLDRERLDILSIATYAPAPPTRRRTKRRRWPPWQPA